MHPTDRIETPSWRDIQDRDERIEELEALLREHQPDPHFGAPCRSKEGVSARYIGFGLCLWVSSTEPTDLECSEWSPGEAQTTRPLPSDDAVLAAKLAIQAFERILNTKKGGS